MERLIPATHQQEGVWYHAIRSGTAYWNFLQSRAYTGELDLSALRRALDLVLRRHASLRTNFRMEEEKLQQVVRDRVEAEDVLYYTPFERDDLPFMDEVIRRELSAEEGHVFDYEKGPLVRLRVLRFQSVCFLILTINHIVTDAHSMRIFWRELMLYYNQYLSGAEVEFPVLERQYLHYAIQQDALFSSNAYAGQKEYWQKRIPDSIPPLNWLFHGRVSKPDVLHSEMDLSCGFAEDIRTLSLRKRILFSSVFLSAYSILLYKYGQQSDVAVANILNGRGFGKRTEEEVIGLFAQRVVHLFKVNPEDTISDFERQVSQEVTADLMNSDVPFEELMRQVNKRTGSGLLPLARAVFNMIHAGGNPSSFMGMAPNPDLDYENAQVGDEQFDLGLSVIQMNTGIRLRMDLKCDPEFGAVPGFMLRAYEEVLKCCVYKTDKKIKDIAIVQQEEHRLLTEFNNTAIEYPADKTLVDLLEERARLSADRIALVFGEIQLSYSEVRERSNQLAHFLREAGVKEDHLVGICMDRCIEMVIGIVGVLKAGAAYVPIDPGYPGERRKYMLSDAGCAIVLCTRRDEQAIRGLHDGRVVLLDEDWGLISEQSKSLPLTGLCPESPAYVIYTSGSTGRPKGVINEHRGVVNRLLWMQRRFGIGEEDSVLQKTTFCFDVSVWEFLWPLLSGARLVLAEPGRQADPVYLRQVIKAHSITVIHFIPSMLGLFLAEMKREEDLKIRFIICSGEELKPGHVSAWREKLSTAALYNLYGPTEAAIDVTWWKAGAEPAIRGNISIGRPVDNTAVYIVGKDGQLNPIGVPGDIYIGGVQVARSYLNRPELTAERFVPDGFSGVAGARLYKTGDLGRWLADGNIEYLGRIDDQVKIRGYRIELGEIESVIQESGLVRQSVVLARDDENGGKRLVGYVVAGDVFDPEELMKYLRDRLPEYMVPVRWVELEEMPQTRNGKVDKAALPKEEGRVRSGAKYVAPRNEVESLLAGIWSTLLGVERVGIEDNFFALGGHSLLATQAVSVARKKFNITLSIKDLFLYPTISQLAVQGKGRTTTAALPVIASQARSQRIPLSYGQQSLWFIDRLDGSVHYHMPVVYRLSGELRADLLEESFQTLVARHEALRTVIREEDGVGYAGVLEAEGWSVKQVGGQGDAEDLPLLIRDLVRAPYDLSADYMLRVTLIRLSPQEHILVIVLHHIAADGWSLGILMRELKQLYEGALSGKPVTLEELPIRYSDYASWQQDWLQGSELESRLAYWRQQLKGVGVLQLPQDYSRPAVQSHRGGVKYRALGAALSRRLREFARERGVTIYMTLLAGFKVLLMRHSGQSDICIGSPIAGRIQPETEGLVGFFVNTLALRSETGGERRFDELLEEVRRVTLEGYDHQLDPFDKVVEAVAGDRSLSQHPLFQVMFTMEMGLGVREGDGLTWGDIGVSKEEYEWESYAKFDLTMAIMQREEEIGCQLSYCRDLYKDNRIERMLEHYEELLKSIVKDPGRRIGELGMLGSQELELLETFSGRGGAASWDNNKTIVDLFQEQVARSPQALALVYGEQRMTYRQLQQRANRLAHYLRSRGVTEDSLVGICLERSMEMVIGILGIITAGGAYVPIDPDYPGERIAYMLEDTGVKILLSSAGSAASVPVSYEGEVLLLDTQSDKLRDFEESRPPTDLRPGHPAYVIYTSGSTGRPKGVMVEHRNLVSYLQNRDVDYTGREDKGKAGAYLQLPYTFDASVTSLFLPLIAGKILVIGSQEATELFAEDTFWDFAPYDFLKLTPAQLPLLREQMESRGCRTIARKMVLGGEALGQQQLQWWKGQGMEMELINEYGPTETTVGCMVYRMDTDGERWFEEAMIPIGRPMGNTYIYLLDAWGRRQPVGIPGEIYVGGAGVARGYLKRPELTTERFVPDRFSGEAGSKLYKTGDLGRWLSDGNLEYLGRIDDQVKIRGYRIELGEIESVIQQSGLVRQSVVLARDDENGGKRLVGYVVTAEVFHREELIKYLQDRLPEYMVPVRWVELETMPQTRNGKVDKAALPKEDGRVDSGAKYVAPRNEVESMLAAIWSSLLGVERVGIEDNFFALGGDSIITIQVSSRAKRQGYKISPKDIFLHKTIERLASVLTAGSTEAAVQAQQGLLQGESGLLPMQQWYLDREGLQEWKSYYNQSQLLWVDKGLSEVELREAIRLLKDRHDALRYRYERSAVGWVQRYEMTQDLKDMLEVIDTSGVADEAGLKEAVRVEGERWQASLDIEAGVMMRAVLYLTPSWAEGHLLLIAIHHLSVDGVSWRIIQEDLEELLKAIRQGEPVRMGAKSSSCRDWYEGLERYGKSRRLQQQRSYWQALMRGENSVLPADWSYEGLVSVKERGVVELRVGEALTRKLLQEVPEAYHTEINDILLSALTRTLCRWSGRQEILIGLEGHGREEGVVPDRDVSRTVGWFTSLYPVSLRREEESGDLVRGVKEGLRQIPDKGLGYGVLKYINKEVALQGTDSWEIVFNYLGQLDSVLQTSDWFRQSDWFSGRAQSGHQRVREKITLNCWIAGGELCLLWGYSAKHYRRETMEELAKEYVKDLEKLIWHCAAAGKGIYTPSDYGLGKEINYKELDQFLNKESAVDVVSSMYRLSGLQQGMLFHSLYDEGVLAYSEQFVCALGEIQPSVLWDSWACLLNRHSILRSSFFYDAFNIPVQCVWEAANLPVEERDLRGMGEEAQQAAIRAYEEEDRHKGFDFMRAPLMRIGLLRLADDRYRMIWTFHHILMDGWSVAVLLDELQSVYELLSSGQQPEQEEEDSYEDYIRYVESKDKEEEESWWRGYLSGLERPVLLPYIGNVSERTKGVGVYDREGLEIDQLFTERIRGYVQQEQVTLNTLMQAVWSYMLYRYTGEQEILFGVTVSGRPESLPGVERRVGLYINALPIHVRIDEERQVGDWLRELQAGQVSSRQYQYNSLLDISQWMGWQGDMFDSLLTFENYPMRKWGESLRWKLGLQNGRTREQTNYPLTLVIGGKDWLWVEFKYNTALLSASVVKRIRDQFMELLRSIVEYPGRRIGELGMLGSQELELLETFSGRGAAASWDNKKTIVDLFQEQAARSPQALALVYGEQRMTYGQLQQRANRLAHYLRSRGVTEDSLVGICLERSMEMVIGILGILTAGGAYVPIDPDYPGERIAYMLEDTGVKILLSSAGSAASVPVSYEGEVLLLDTQSDKLQDFEESRPPTNLRPGHPAYVIYTSGSTGRPKGVMVEHRNLVSYLQNRDVDYTGREDKGKAGAYLQLPYTFDASVTSLFLPLIAGKILVIGSQEATELFAEDTFWDFAPYDFLKLTPAQLPLLREQMESRGCRTIARKMVLGGEALGQQQLQWWKGQGMEMELINEYGPTETTVGCMVYRMDTDGERWFEEAMIPIGRPMGNTYIYLLDAWGRRQPVGIPGEIYVGGAGVARGYLKRPELTTERFVPDRFSGEAGSKLYKTGDLGRWLSDGNLEYLGRIDDQVKIRGYRIELGEIESVIQQSGLVRQSVVLAREDENGGKRLVGYVVAAESAVFHREELMKYLQDRLPEYMVPVRWVELETMPQTRNGKVDKASLPKEDGRVDSGAKYVAPRNEVESMLAAVWSSLLGVERVGIEDNFFALGGHSLLIIPLVKQIRSHRYTMQFRDALKYQTIVELAGYLESLPVEMRETGSPHVHVLQEGTGPSAVFILAGSPGFTDGYSELARAFGDIYTVYGIQLIGLNGGEKALHNLKETAEFARKCIQRVQTEGPYQFIGHSMGGNLAFEIVKQLEAAGEKVEFLILLDSSADLYRAGRMSEGMTIDQDLMQGICMFLKNYDLSHFFPPAWPDEMMLALASIANVRKPEFIVDAIKTRVRQSRDIELVLKAAYNIAVHLLMRYHYQPEGEIQAKTLLVKAEEVSWSSYDRHLGWKDFAPGMTVITSPGNHTSLIRNKNVQVLMARIKENIHL